MMRASAHVTRNQTSNTFTNSLPQDVLLSMDQNLQHSLRVKPPPPLTILLPSLLLPPLDPPHSQDTCWVPSDEAQVPARRVRSSRCPQCAEVGRARKTWAIMCLCVCVGGWVGGWVGGYGCLCVCVCGFGKRVLFARIWVFL